MAIEAADLFSKHIEQSRFEDFDNETINKIKIFLLDSIGVGIAGSTGANLLELKQVSNGWSKGNDCTILGTWEKYSRDAATLINAYQIHCLEFDCIHEGAVVHPMAAILSSLLAHCETLNNEGRHINGKEFLLALALGVDIASFLGISAKGELKFFRPATASGFGAIAALSKIQKFSVEEIHNALGIMYSQTCGNMQSHVEGVPILGLQVGFNAKAALSSMDLTLAGFPGPKRVFNGEHGYFKLIENDNFDTRYLQDNIGKIWMVNQLAHKPYPSGRLTHGLVHAIKDLKLNYGLNKDEINSIECLVPPGVYKLVARPLIDNLTTNYAKLCAKFVGASYMINGHLDIDSFTDQKYLTNAETLEFARKITMIKNENLDQKVLTPQKFSVKLTNNKKIEINLDHVYGHPKAALSESEYLEKFHKCCLSSTKKIPKNKIDEMIDFILDLENQKNVIDFFKII
ncbi:MmgE/PrpD family protein [Alphaproteobacteria bacterium]|nr:MmgE/PrpD family protein [Alphaproteobacteria bacterium]